MQLQFLFIPHSDMLELGGERKHSKQLDLAECRSQQLAVRLHGLVSAVEVRRDSAQLRRLKMAGFSLVFHQARPVEKKKNYLNLLKKVGENLEFDDRCGAMVGILAYYARGRGFDSRTVQTFVSMNMSVCIGSGCFYV
jgi:ABC-type transporter Mla MlaB component